MKGTKPNLSVDPEAVTEDMAPPDWLSDEAKAEWHRVFPMLVRRRILTVADLGSLENYCVEMGTIRIMERFLQKNGYTMQTFRNGMRKRPEVTIKADAMNRARLLAAELGLTPVSRSRPAIREGDDADSLLDF